MDQSELAEAKKVTRRSFLRVTILAGVCVPLLAACGLTTTSAVPSASVTPSPTGVLSAGITLPTYLPASGAKPDLAGTPDGIDPGYFAYPANPFKSVSQPPGKGGDVTIMTQNNGGAITPVDQNPAWQEVNKQIGANVKLDSIPFADYATRLAAVMAGGDLADIFYISASASIRAFTNFLQSQCADLTPYLSGDAIKDYPNLAAIPTRIWKGMIFGGGIYGIPIPGPLFGYGLWVHQELMDNAGLTQPRTADDFKRVLQMLNKSGVSGIVIEGGGSGFGVANGLYPSIFGAPNNWQLEGSKLVKDFETDEYKASLGYARDLFAAGVYTPDSITSNNVAGKADFAARKSAMRWDGWDGTGAISFWDQSLALDPPSKLRHVLPFSANGGKPSYYMATGNFGFNVIKKATPERVKELLGVLNFTASPFGSQEHLLLNYGLKDVHYTLDPKGNPISSPKGKSDVGFAWTYAGKPAQVLYYPKAAQEYATVSQDEERAMAAAFVEDPTFGYYSDTAGSTGNALFAAFASGVTDIVAGRRPLSDFDQLVQDWRSGGGDQMRTEFMNAIGALK